MISLYINRYKFCNDVCNDFVTMNPYDIDRNQEAKQTQGQPEKQRAQPKARGSLERSGSDGEESEKCNRLD
jgi:hypothetical protein